MSDLPPPPASPLPPSVPPADPRKQVELPAYGLMAVGALNFLWILYLIAGSLFGMAIMGAGAGGGKFGFLVSGIGTVIQILWALAVGGITVYGAMQMKSLRNYNLALAAAIAAIIPCNYCCCVGIGVGIWALVILMKPEVKAAFINK